MFRRVEPPTVDALAPPRPPTRLRVFSVEPTSVQIDWSALGPGPVRFQACGTVIDLVADGGPGAVVLEPLPPSTDVEIRVEGAGMAGEDTTRSVRTLDHPPGAELFRIGAITDLHIGSRRFGKAGTLTERPRPETPHPLRCARAAVKRCTNVGSAGHPGQRRPDRVEPAAALGRRGRADR